MQEINYGVILVAAVATFVASGVYYGVFGKALAKYSKANKATKPGLKQAIVEMLRNIVLALVIAQLVHLIGNYDWGSAIGLSLLLWIGFPVILLSGSVMYEKAAYQLALLHGGDWLLKLVLITSIVSLWR